MFRSFVPIVVAAALVVLVAGVASPAFGAPDKTTIKTIDNLQAAFNGESNAHARYLAFAEKAKQDGYGPVASLFRAAARAEKVHADNHADALRKLGVTAVAKIETPNVKSTQENLEAAIKGEVYERDVMYPEFITTATAEGQQRALRSFNLARTAEAEHANLYSDSLKNLDTLKIAAGKTYYVCEVCGLTTTNLDFEKCISCFSPKERYVAVS